MVWEGYGEGRSIYKCYQTAVFLNILHHRVNVFSNSTNHASSLRFSYQSNCQISWIFFSQDGVDGFGLVYLGIWLPITVIHYIFFVRLCVPAGSSGHLSITRSELKKIKGHHNNKHLIQSWRLYKYNKYDFLFQFWFI